MLARVSPDLLVLGELELWPNLLACTHARGIPIVVANARMSEQSARGYSRIRPVVRWMLKKVSLVLARSQADADRFMAFGATDVIVTGSMKFDGVNGDRNAPDVVRLKQQAGLTATDIVFLAGSTQSPEEQCAIDIFSSLQRSHPSLKLIIVPRHVERCAEIEQLLIEAQLPWQVRSQQMVFPSIVEDLQQNRSLHTFHFIAIITAKSMPSITHCRERSSQDI